MEQEFYYLRVSSNSAEVVCLLNGFPVYDISTEGQVANQLPVNLALIGKGNKLLILIKSLGDNAFVKGSVTLYKSGEVVSSDDERKNVVEFTIDASKEQERLITFDNEQFDFSEVILRSPVINDTSQLIEYALKLKSWVKNHDIEKLLEHMSPKVRDYALSYSVEEEIIRESLKQSFTGDMFNMEWEEVSREDVIPVSYCEGRIWELTTSKGHPLFYSENEEGHTSLPVYVAEINGEMRVVR
ncbi:hypothetical protein [Fulvivirga imtechensis]|nr:hypothetical protein [Fulvivirga imtechensis]